MVKSVFNTVYSEIRGLHQAAYVLGTFTLASQFLALIRDRLLAHHFGAGIDLDLYFTAFRIPDLLYVLFASTLSVYVLIPFVAERIASGGATRARDLLSCIFSLFLLIYSGLALGIILFAPTIVSLFFPGFAHSEETLVALVRILMLQPFFLGLSSLLGVITQFEHRFILYAISPLLYNVGIICGVLFFYPIYGLVGLMWGVVFGAFGHLVIQLPFILRNELAPRFTFRIPWKEIYEVLRVSIPRALTLSFHQFVLFGFISFASVMTIGSVSVFQFAFNLQSVPLAIIGMSYSVAAFPILARLHAEKSYAEFSKLIMNALRHIIFWSIPIIALFVVVRAQFVRIVLGSGAFDWGDTRLTAAVLALFAISLVAQAVQLLLIRALYAAQNTRIPFYTTLASSIMAIVFALGFHTLITSHGTFYNFLTSLMRLEGVSGIEVLALPLGYSAALMVQACVLFLVSRKRLYMRTTVIVGSLMRSLIAACVAGFCAYTTLNFYVTGIETDTLLTIFFQGLFASCIGLLGAAFTYYLVRSPELGEVYESLHRRMFKKKPVGPQDEDTLSI